MTAVHLGLGSNLGDREGNLRRALAELNAGGFTDDRVSPLYETEPVGPVKKQPRFLNCVARGAWTGTARELLGLIAHVEKRLGRRRGRVKGPRTIDVDILYFRGEKIDEPPTLVVPHPAIPERRFVLLPLVEIDPDLVHPRLGKTQIELLGETSDRGGADRYPGVL